MATVGVKGLIWVICHLFVRRLVENIRDDVCGHVSRTTSGILLHHIELWRFRSTYQPVPDWVRCAGPPCNRWIDQLLRNYYKPVVECHSTCLHGSDDMLQVKRYSFSHTHLRATERHLSHMGSHSVTCHQPQVNAPRFNSSQASLYSINLFWRDKRLSWPRWMATCRM